MAKSTLYNFNSAAPVSISREDYLNVGSGENILGNVKRGIKGSTDFEIWDAPIGGTQLTEGVDYDLVNIDTELTAAAGYTIYTGYQITNVTYQTGTIYITYKIVFSYTDADFINALSQSSGFQVYNTSVDYTVLDNDGFYGILVDSTDGNVDITLPTASANGNRQLLIFATVDGGKISITPEGSDEINGVNAAQYLMSKNNFMLLYGNGVDGWVIQNRKQTYRIGWFNTSDQTNRHYGTPTFAFDNRSGAFTDGEEIEESTTGNTWVLQSMTDAATGTIIARVKSGTGYATNNETITGASSGETCDVNEGGGTSKNSDSNLLHGFGKNLKDLDVSIYWSSDGTENNSYLVYNNMGSGGGGADYGYGVYQIDTDNLKIQTGVSGFVYLNDSGGWAAIGSADDYFDIWVTVTE